MANLTQIRNAKRIRPIRARGVELAETRRRSGPRSGGRHSIRHAESARRWRKWLRSAVSALADGGCDDVVVVLGAAVVDVPAPARAVVAGDWAEGMSASLRAGISALRIRSRRLRGADDRRHAGHRRRRGAARARPPPVARPQVSLGPGTGDGRVTRSSSRVRIGRSWSPRRAATKGRGRFWRPAPMWPGWTAPTWRRVTTSTSIGAT